MAELVAAPMNYLDEADLAERLSAVSYKPGWRFTLHRHPFEGLCVDISMSQPNGYQPDEMVDLNVRVPVPPIVNGEHFHDWLLWRLARVESHEMREFYRVDGALISDPHAEDVLMS